MWARVYSNAIMKVIVSAVTADDLLPRGQICISGSTWTNLTFCYFLPTVYSPLSHV